MSKQSRFFFLWEYLYLKSWAYFHSSRSTLSLLMFWVKANHPHRAFSFHDLTTFTNFSYRRFNFHFTLKVILPRLKSYGESSNFTLSPGSILIKFMRIFPETCARTTWPFSSCTLNMALGRVSIISPSVSISSSFIFNGSKFPALLQ